MSTREGGAMGRPSLIQKKGRVQLRVRTRWMLSQNQPYTSHATIGMPCLNFNCAVQLESLTFFEICLSVAKNMFRSALMLDTCPFFVVQNDPCNVSWLEKLRLVLKCSLLVQGGAPVC